MGDNTTYTNVREHNAIEEKLKVLVVDDKAENLIAMQKILKHINAEIDVVDNGNEALSKMLRNNYALALVDVQMPEMDGYELVELMKMNPQTEKTPVIFVTAINVEKENIHKGYDAGAIDYLCKPVDTKELTSKINYFLNEHKEKTELNKLLEKYKLYSSIATERKANQKLNDSNGYKPKILVVDDREENIFAMTKILNKLNVQVDFALSGQAALDLASKNEYAAIILDAQMPDMDGFETATQLKENEKTKNYPIIFVTALSKEDYHIQNGYKCGAVDYLFKPINPQILMSKVKIFVDLFNQKAILQDILRERENTLGQMEQQKDHLGFLAYNDPLTLIPNKKGFHNALERYIKKAIANNQKFAVIQIDIDHFKVLNDTFGHKCGDLILQEVANQIKKFLRKDDFVARLGGDSFGIIIDEIKSVHDAGNLMQKITARFNDSLSVAGHSVRVSLSSGIACYIDNTGQPIDELMEDLMSGADNAMSKAKHQSRGAYQYFTTEVKKEHEFRVKAEEQLKNALVNDELFMTYQPKFDLRTRKIVGVEALVRWQNPELGLVPPNIFIPLAEDTNQIIPISEWVFEQSCKDLRAWIDAGFQDAKLALNVSPIQLIDKNFFKNAHEILNELNLKPYQLELELRETAIMEKNKLVYDSLKEVNGVGLVISIDDFGTGYFMLSYLKDLPIDSLKIDMEFIKQVDKSRADALIVRSIIGLAKNFNLSVIAEGIEKEEQLKFLVENGCPYGQGYYFSMPLTNDDFIKYLRENKHIS